MKTLLLSLARAFGALLVFNLCLLVITSAAPAAVVLSVPSQDDMDQAQSNPALRAVVQIGNSLFTSNTSQELIIRGTGAATVTADTTFVSGTSYDFSLVDSGGGSDRISVNVDGSRVSTNAFVPSSTGNALVFDALASINTSSISVTNLTFNGEPLPALGAVGGTRDSYLISGFNTFDGSVITGTVMFNRGATSPSNDDLQFSVSLIQSENAAAVPEPLSIFGAIGGFAYLGLGRQRRA